MIIAAAVMIDGEPKALPAPARHHHILHRWPLSRHEHGEQGFIDHELGFLGRVQAMHRARDERQEFKREPRGQLYSEDLW